MKKKIPKKKTTRNNDVDSEELVDEEELSSDSNEVEKDSSEESSSEESLDDSNKNDEDENDYLAIGEEENIKYKENLVLDKDRITIPRLTKYEFVRIVGERYKQLSMGSSTTLKKYNSKNDKLKDDYGNKDLKNVMSETNQSYEEIAIEEIKQGCLPYKIIRPLPDGSFEMWNINELSYDHIDIE
jgi:DNA-directed RNA polymerase subunit K/omega